MKAAQPGQRVTRSSTGLAAFTLVELMVVVAVLAILIGSVVTVSTVVVRNAEVSQTRAIMQNIDLAIEQFRTDSPLGGLAEYRDRYRGYPSDELEPFVSNTGIPTTAAPPGKYIGPGRGSDLRFSGAGLETLFNKDIKAMGLAIRLFSSEGGAILDRIDAKYRKPAPLNEFFDRDGSGGSSPDTDDLPLDVFVDAWGLPLEYYAVNPKDGPNANAPSDPKGHRLEATIFLVETNRGKPVLVSYGPDGPDQCSPEFIQTEGETHMVADYHDTPSNKAIDDPFNDDNVYLDEGLKERLKESVN